MNDIEEEKEIKREVLNRISQIKRIFPQFAQYLRRLRDSK